MTNKSGMVDGRLVKALAPLALELGQTKEPICVILVTKRASYQITLFNGGWLHEVLEGQNGCSGADSDVPESDVIALELRCGSTQRTMRYGELMALSK